MGMIYKRGKTYWIKYYRNGKPFYESSKSHKESKAKRLLKKREGEISQGKLPGIYFDRVKFDELADDFLADYRINQKKSLVKAKKLQKRLQSPKVVGLAGSVEPDNPLILLVKGQKITKTVTIAKGGGNGRLSGTG